MSLSKLELAKSKIALHAGWAISLTSKLEFVEAPGCGTAGTDGRRVFYEPDWVNSLTLPQIIGLIFHEVGHNMLSHPSRVGEREYKDVANISMDIALNELLQTYFEETKSTLGAELPPEGMYGSQFDQFKGQNWEKIYGTLVDMYKQNGGGEGGEGEGKAGKKKGSGSGGLPKQFDDVQQAKHPDGSSMSKEEADALAKEWTMAAQQAATMAKQRGSMPGFMQELIADMAHPKVDWRAQIRDFFTKVARDEMSYRRFNRRFQHAEMYLPGMYSERIGRVAFYVDTSGSMGSEEFKLAMGAMNDILEELKPDEILFGQCDTRMVSEEIVKPDDLPLTAKEFKGRGGTELSPMFEHNKKQDVQPELLVVLTDGCFSPISTDLQPECPVLWIVTTDSLEAAEKSFGRVVRVEA